MRDDTLTRTEQSRGTILLVDDEELALRTMHRILARSFPGLEIRTARDGDEAIDLLDDDVVCVVADVDMPGRDGFRLCWSIRNSAACGPWRGLPIVLVSGSRSDDEALEEAWRVGTAQLLPKPFGSLEIERAVARAIATRPAPRDREARDRATGPRPPLALPAHEVRS